MSYNEANDPNKCFHHTVGGAQVGGDGVCCDHFPKPHFWDKVTINDSHLNHHMKLGSTI